MKMGIERALKARFGDLVKEVVQVGDDGRDVLVSGGGGGSGEVDPDAAAVAEIEQHLTMLRGAVQAYGGVVEVLSLQGGELRLRFTGPEMIGKGIRAALKDRFPSLTTIDMVA
jgi:NFU1 iron-sulfur cluster scaffold homolog, mitochondrial